MGNKQSKKFKNKSRNKATDSNTFDAEWISQEGKLYKQLRNEWKIGSKCIMFSEAFKQWIYTKIKKIENKQGGEYSKTRSTDSREICILTLLRTNLHTAEQILTVKNYGDW
eukprot:528948_1